MECILTCGAGAGNAGGITAWRRSVCPRGVPLSVYVNPHFIVSADTHALLTAIQVAKGYPGI